MGEFTFPMDNEIENRIRGDQVYVMEQNIEPSHLGYLIGVVFTFILFVQSWTLVVSAWSVMVFMTCGFRFHLARRTVARPAVPLNETAIRRYVILSCLLSATMASGPAWVAMHSEGFTNFYMTLFVVSTLWGGVLVYVSVFPVTAAFITVQVLMLMLCSLHAGFDNDALKILLLFTLTAAVAVILSWQLSRRFESALRQQIVLEQQKDVIDLLLKEHEEESSDWLWQTDAGLRVSQPPKRFAEALRQAPEDIQGKLFPDLLLANHVAGNNDACAILSGHLAAHRPFRDLVVPGEIDGAERWWSISGRPIRNRNDAFVGYSGVMADVTTALQAQARVAHLAHHDALTDLPNRAYFHQRLKARLQSLGGERLAVMGIDLDGFKPVNDRYGHFVGDALLVAVGERMRGEVAAADLVARLGGDEFAIKTKTTDLSEMESLCDRLLKAIGQPFFIDGVKINIGVSIGVAFAPDDGISADELMKHADAALYRAKRDGRGTYRFFAADLDNRQQERLLLIQDLRDALSRSELVLHYQPFIEAETGAVTGCEALLRWQHPTRGLVPPAEFIPLAEESGLIVQIGAWVIKAACAEAATWPNNRRVSVNISPVEFHDRDLPDRILSALSESGLQPDQLEIELTETVLVSDAGAALDILRRLRALGIRVALDDFGTGYSSLSYLSFFPFDRVKIDRSFVRKLGTRSDSQVIVRAIHDIARGLNMAITAEGVENAEQERILRLIGCHELQGYLYGRPCTVLDLETVFEPVSLFRMGTHKTSGVADAV